MKRTYLTPSTHIHHIGAHNIICTSTPKIQSGTANTDEEQDGGGYMLSKEGADGFWD